MTACYQLLFGMMCMDLHSNYDGDGNKTMFDVQHCIADVYTPYARHVDEDWFLCGFGHIFTVGHSAWGTAATSGPSS